MQSGAKCSALRALFGYMMNIVRVTGFMIMMLAAAAAGVSVVSDFAAEVVAVQGVFDGSRYRDPSAILGKPAVRCKNDLGHDPQLPFSFRVKLVEAAYNLDLDDGSVVTTIGSLDSVTVKFDHEVMDCPLNPYGQDFIVFGNSFFQYNRTEKISDATNLNTMFLANPTALSPGRVYVSVSQDGQTWYSFDPNSGDPNSHFRADTLYPTHGYEWDRQSGQWTDREMDFTKPVNPALKLSDFSGLSVADALQLYDGSGGGTPFDLKNLTNYEQLIPDPNTGYRWIEYVRFEGSGILWDMDGEVDAVADVAACGDPTHAYPAGDITKDCRVDLWDLAILAGSWLECTYQCE